MNKKYPLHFQFEIEGKSYLYAYIRKSGSSGFKNLLEQECLGQKNKSSDRILPLIRNFGVTSPNQIKNIDYSFFVIREPYERLVSFYIERFIKRHNLHCDIKKKIEKRMDKSYAESSFRDFLDLYVLKYPLYSLDPHVVPQAFFLMPICYTHIFCLDNLSEAIQQIFSQRVAGKYFSDKVHSMEKVFKQTTHTTLSENCFTIQSQDLFHAYNDHKKYISKDLFFNACYFDLICGLFKQDCNIYNSVKYRDSRKAAA